MLVSEILRIKGNALFTTPPNGSVLEAVKAMAQQDIGSLVVMDRGQMMGMLTFAEVLERLARYVPVQEGPTLLGVVSFHDVAKAVYEEQSFENRMLKSYIKSSPDE